MREGVWNEPFPTLRFWNQTFSTSPELNSCGGCSQAVSGHVPGVAMGVPILQSLSWCQKPLDKSGCGVGVPAWQCHCDKGPRAHSSAITAALICRGCSLCPRQPQSRAPEHRKARRDSYHRNIKIPAGFQLQVQPLITAISLQALAKHQPPFCVPADSLGVQDGKLAGVSHELALTKEQLCVSPSSECWGFSHLFLAFQLPVFCLGYPVIFLWQ